MKILIVGSGAREHALGWKFKQENPASELFFAPGNGGTGLLGKNAAKEEGESWASLAGRLQADMVVFGPEAPLADGAADDLVMFGYRVFGPGRAAAQLEASKIYARTFCRKWKIPSPQAQFVILPPCRDYKRLKDRHEGPNTGGMGAIAPIAIEKSLWPVLTDNFLEPFRRGLEKEGILYKGVIYFGLMLTKETPKCLEFNVRFGDPEAQAVIPLTDLPYLEIMQATQEGMLSKFPHDFFLNYLVNHPKASACVVMASEGYPNESATGRVIEGLGGVQSGAVFSDNVLVLHAGTVKEADRLITSGGRVLSVVGTGKNADEARQAAYEAVRKIRFEGAQFRMDIGS
ncbi:MAG: hypothetical protein HY747_01845 [Elusimicrobia bacterium]|nr:hypothetical protein [Elusimicrobiota bacterium]